MHPPISLFSRTGLKSRSHRLTLLLVILAFSFLSLDRAQAQEGCQLSSDFKPISQCLDGSRNIIVGSGGKPGCAKVVSDQDFTGDSALNKITVQADGELHIKDESRKIDLQSLTVAGLVQIGSPICPIGNGDPSHQVLF